MMFQNMMTPYRRIILMTLLLAMSPLSGQAASAGRVEFATRGVTATGADGKTRTLSKDAVVEAGDLIQTADGRLQLRFSDGGYVSLQPNTEFRIDEYRFEGKADGSEKSFFSLIKGGLRAITGAIGHVNKKNYQINTAPATIGVSGTEFLAQLDDTLQMTCGEGVCVLFNEAGELVLYAGESGRAHHRNIAPEATSEKPELPPAQNDRAPHLMMYSLAENRDVRSNPCMITGCATENSILSSGLGPLGNGYVAAFTDSGVSGNSYAASSMATVDNGSGFAAAFNGSGQLTSLRGGNTEVAGQAVNFTSGENSLTITSGSDGIIAWGRWLGNASEGGIVGQAARFGPRDGWHYVVGLPTSDNDLNRLSFGGTTATYAMIGATAPSSPSLGNGTFNGALNVDFGNQQLQARVDVQFVAGAAHFGYNNTIGSFGVATPGSIFLGTGHSTNGSLCGGDGCLLNLRGFFAGPGASRAGMAYEITGARLVDSINGAAAFTRAGAGSIINAPM